MFGLLTACAAQPQVVVQPNDSTRYAPAVAAALAMDPPALAGQPRLELSRENREIAAFAGYQDVTTTSYFLSLEDDQGGIGRSEPFERQAISQTFGTRYK